MMYRPGFQPPGGFGGGLPSLGKGGPRPPSNPQPPATLPTETAPTQPPQQGGITPMPIVDYQRPGMGKGGQRPPQGPPMNSIGFPGQYPQPPMRPPMRNPYFGGGFGGGFGGMPFFGGIGGFMPRFGFRNPFFGGGRFNNPYFGGGFGGGMPFMPEPYPSMPRPYRPPMPQNPFDGFLDFYRRQTGDTDQDVRDRMNADLARRGVTPQPTDPTLEAQSPLGPQPSRRMPRGIAGLMRNIGPMA